ncbi:EF-hand domain-containing protein [archaeon]|nr:MAG: EF-hand domain-containing protein [archaeon]
MYCILNSIGELDKEELRNLMVKMGLHISHKRLNDLMNKYDVDQGGKLELHEFLMLLKSQYKEASSRMKELTECPIMVYKHDTRTRYIPPEGGILHITVMDGFARKKIYRIMNACDREAIHAVTKEVGGISGMNMLSSSLQGTKLRLGK